MVNLKINVVDQVSPGPEYLTKALEDRTALNADIGRRVANDLRKHFAMRQAEGPRNKFGAPTSNFWGEVRQATSDAEPTDNGGTVTIAHPAIAQKVYGGTIRADDKLLSIPARAEAYGKSPRTFANLKAIFFEHGGALVEVDATKVRSRKTKDGGRKFSSGGTLGGLVFYWLVEQVTQKKDPDALPSEAVLLEGILDTGRKHIERIVERGAESPGTES